MKANTMKFYAQLVIVGLLIAIGTLALIGEPASDANFIVTVIGQLVVTALSWTIAGALGRKWQINRKMTYTRLAK